MDRPKRLGMLTPSSNTALEPLTQAMLAGLPEVTAHFSRFRVVEISLAARALSQFDDDALLRAAELLADARADVICWNGTSSGWLGFEADERLCERITAATGIPATTSMLALNELFKQAGVTRYGLVTPYLDDVQARILRNYDGLGHACTGERHLGLQENFTFAEVTEDTLRRMVAEVAESRPQAIAIICTNLRAAGLAASLEAAHGIPVYDTVATAVWKSLKLAGVAPDRVQGWGRLFQAG